MDYKAEYEKLLIENSRLRAENVELKQRLGILDNVSEAAEQPKQKAIDTVQQTEAVLSQASVTMHSTPQEKISLFMSLFRGRSDVYAKRWYSEKSGKSGYQPVCRNEWNTWLCDKRKVKCAECKNRSFAPLTENAIYKHLQGKSALGTDTIGIYPLTEDECCYFLAMDFDGGGWQDDITAVRGVCKRYEIPMLVERSRSGQGGHVWFFFEDKIRAVKARRFGTLLLNGAMRLRHTIGFSAYDRLFPNQDVMPKGGFGNLIALPLQGLPRRRGNSVFVDENFVAYADQWAVLSCVKRLSENELDEFFEALNEYSDPLDIPTDITTYSPTQVKPIKTKLTSDDFGKTVEIICSNMIYIDKGGISERALDTIRRMGAFANPEYYKALKMRLPAYDKPRVISVYQEDNRYLALPRGRLDRLRALLKDCDIEYTFKDNRNCGEKIEVEFDGTLRDEQQRAFSALTSRDIGVLSATTAFGKTVVGARIIAERKRNVLVLVHTSALLNQWKEALIRFLSFKYSLPEQPKSRGRKKAVSYVGQLGATKNTLNGRVDIAIIQSLVGKDGVKDLVSNYGLVIVDECHHVPAFMFEQVLKTVNAKYVYGLTATPIRADGRQESIFMQCGDIAYKIDAKEQAQKQLFEHFTVPRFTDFRMPLMPDGGYRSLNNIMAELCLSKARNKLIVDDVIKAVDCGRTPIILTERTEHAKILTDAIERQGVKVFMLVGKESVKLKREKISALAATSKTEKFVIVAIGRYVGEGFDFARLDTLFLAMPISWKGKLAQYAGRLHRDYAGKSEVIIYDYVDLNVSMLENMYHKRLAGYKDIGYEIHVDVKSKKHGILYGKTDFKRVFDDDFSSTKSNVLIVSPSLSAGRITRLLRLYAAMINKPRVVVATRKTDDENSIGQIARLKNVGIEVLEHDDLHLRCAVMDNSLVWYGSICPIGYASDTDNILRFDSNEIAEMLNAQFR